MIRQFLLMAALFLMLKTGAQNMEYSIKSAWQFRKQGDHSWMKATVPGTVHTDLMANKVIPDPYYRDNENKVQWVSKENWEYQTVFNVDKKALSKKNIELVFEG